MIRRAGGAAAALVVVAAAAALWARRPVTVFHQEGPHGAVRVVEHHDGLRALFIGEGRARQSAVYPGRPLHLVQAYTRTAMVGLALAPERPRLLFVGLGGGAMPAYARRILPSARIDVVEIDSLVVHVARRFFGIGGDGGLAIHVADGRAFIERAPDDSWDVVFLDAFFDDEIPFALTTLEFLSSVRRGLAPGGVVVANVWTSQAAFPSMVATYRAAFPDVALLQVPGRRQVILLASPDSGRLDTGALEAAVVDLTRRVELGFDLPALMDGQARPPSAGTAPVLRDAADASPPGQAHAPGLP